MRQYNTSSSIEADDDFHSLNIFRPPQRLQRRRLDTYASPSLAAGGGGGDPEQENQVLNGCVGGQCACVYTRNVVRAGLINLGSVVLVPYTCVTSIDRYVSLRIAQ